MDWFKIWNTGKELAATFLAAIFPSAAKNQKEDFLVQLAFRYSSTQLDDLAGWPVAVPAVTLPLPPAVGTFQVPGFFKGPAGVLKGSTTTGEIHTSTYSPSKVLL